MSASALPAFVEPLGDGIFAVDTGFHRDRYDAAYLLVEDGRAAFVDTGTALAVPRLLAALDALGVARTAVDHVIATHVHLDHAGGVGPLMQALPAARLVVHPRGARHMADPAQLWQAATAVYGGAQMARAYGALTPVDAARIDTTADGQTIALAGRPLRFAHTPGHARHHHCVWDERSRGWFTGDTFGIAAPELAVGGRHFIFPTTTPTQFDAGQMTASIARLMAESPRRMYLTHYGAIDDVADCRVRLEALLADMLAALAATRGADDPLAALEAALLALYVRRAREFGVALPPARLEALLIDDVRLNAAGIVHDAPRP